MPDTETPTADALARADADTPADSQRSRHRARDSVTIAGYFPKAVHRQLRTLGVMQDRTVQSLLGEALNELFRKHGKRPIARE